MDIRLSGISSMATRRVLADLTAAYRALSDVDVGIESVGGVDAAGRVVAGEAFDVVILAADAIDKLISGGSVLADSRVDLVRSPVAIAVREGTAPPDVASEDGLLRAVLAATSLGYSTGPSGNALLKLFERWGVADRLRERLVQAPAGVPVAQLVAGGRVELGFQQLSEMLAAPGIRVIGGMPPGCEIVSTFSGGVCTASLHPEAVRALLAFMQSPATAAAKRKHGMEPA
ncbi:MAG: substrate-binding domain-containing protein [Rhodocyclales bacterium]|nr:substrate-binding domain-containing protein [Rhodocyclales bacterium]